jgi:hypothetical protein
MFGSFSNSLAKGKRNVMGAHDFNDLIKPRFTAASNACAFLSKPRS